MPGLFSRKKRNDYQGFAKYTEAYTPPAVQQPRSQSMTNASLAALAALAMHNKNDQAAPEQSYYPSLQAYQASGRANSLAGNRANSMRSYTYNPKPSYQAGPAANRSYSLRSNSLRGAPPIRSNSLSQRPAPAAARAPQVQRASSLTQKPTLIGRTGSLTRSPLSQRAGSLTGSQRGLNSLLGFNEEDEEFNEEDVISTTKTTKVVDSMGRTCSITTETIRTLPDGSNVVETTTKNLSRPTSRSNSFRNNSLTINHSNANYNLNKIDEDLQDFDYNYLDQHPSQPPRLNYGHEEPSRESNNSQSLGPAFDAPSRSKEFVQNSAPPPAREQIEPATSPLNSASPRLKSILKHSPNVPRPILPPDVSADRLKHNLSPNEADFKDAHEQLHDPYSQPQKATVASNASGGNSIKFLEQVEEIPYEANAQNLAEFSRAESLKQEKEKQDSILMYEQAMKVAMERVYGTSEAPALALTPPQTPKEHFESPQAKVDDLADKKVKKDHKREKDEGGVSTNYIYENHHKDFALRSLRGEEEPGSSSRKERAKEEKRQKKEEEKRKADLLKLAEKEKKNDEKEESKRQRKSSKNPLSFLGIKMRRGSQGSITSSSFSGNRQDKANEETLQFSSESGTKASPQQPVTKAEEKSASVEEGPINSYNNPYSFPQKSEAANVETKLASVGNRDTAQLQESAYATPTSKTPSTFDKAIGKTVTDTPTDEVFAKPERQDFSVPPRSPLRDSSAVEKERHLRSLSEGSNMTDFLNEPAQLEKPVPIGEVDEAFHDSRDDFIDVPEEYNDEPTNADGGLPETLIDQEPYKVINVPASPREGGVVSDVKSPSAAKANQTEPVPEAAEVPERPQSTEQRYGDTTYRAPPEDATKQAVGEELPTLVAGENNHPVVLGQTAEKDQSHGYSTLDPGSPSSRGGPAQARNDAATVSSDESAVAIPAPSKEHLDERADVNPEIAHTSAGALEPSAAIETEFQPYQAQSSVAAAPQTIETESTESSYADPEVTEATAGTVGAESHHPVPDSLGVRHNKEGPSREQPSYSSGEATEVSVPSQQEKNAKPKKKRGHKFKKMIDKYFISSYSR